MIPLFLSNILLNLTPFTSAIFAYLFLGEEINRVTIISMIAGFIGVIIIAKSTHENKS